MTGPAGPGRRPVELAGSLALVRSRIEHACAAAGRDPAEVTLLAVTKTFPAADVTGLVDLGLREFGESREPEAGRKVAEVASLRPLARLHWHFVGRLQRNKARSVVAWAAMVQSVDSDRLADALAAEACRALDAGQRPAPLEVLVQASLDQPDDATRRGGVPLPGLPALADRVAAAAGLELRGVMAVAPLGSDPDGAFARLAVAAARLRAVHPGATVLSAGMSGDLEAAVRHGSTCVRVGTALLGRRRLASP